MGRHTARRRQWTPRSRITPSRGNRWGFSAVPFPPVLDPVLDRGGGDKHTVIRQRLQLAVRYGKPSSMTKRTAVSTTRLV